MTDRQPSQAASRVAARLRAEALSGAQTMAPFLLALIPFALLLGGVVGASLDPAAGLAGTLPIYGGSAQLATLEAVNRGAGLWVAVAAGVLVNLRVVVYSSALASLWAGSRWWHKLPAAAFVIDQTWMVAERRAAAPGTMAERRAHYVGAAAILTVGWLVTVTIGMVVAQSFGVVRYLGAALPLCLVALVIPHLKRPGAAAAVTAAVVVAWLARELPAGSGLLLAMAAAAVVGSASAKRESS